MQIHPVFHISLLEPAPPRGQLDKSTELESEEEYEVEKILNHRGEGPQTEYLVKWKGYGNDENTWEPLASHSTTSWQRHQKAERGASPAFSLDEATQTTPHRVVERTTQDQSLMAADLVA